MFYKTKPCFLIWKLKSIAVILLAEIRIEDNILRALSLSHAPYRAKQSTAPHKNGVPSLTTAQVLGFILKYIDKDDTYWAMT